MKFGSAPYPALALHLAWHFEWLESFSLHSRSASQCRTLGRSRPRLAGLVPLMGKASVSNITVSLGFVVVPKALAMARLLAAAGLLMILPLSSSRFCPLAPYCYHPLPGWHRTAHPRLAPDCYYVAGTLLLLSGWHPTATHRLAPYCSSSLAGIPSAWWLRSPSTLPNGWPLLSYA